MNFDELLDFVANRMQMAHVYQPLIIEFLARAGGTATVRQLAVDMAASDEAAVAFYSDRITKMPVKVLKERGIVAKDGDLVSLTAKTLTYEQRAKLIAACEARIAKYLSERGIDIWSGLIETAAVPEQIRYDILARDRKCLLCGKGPDEVMLQVDHIVPRAKGGSNDPSNLQTLCAPCNRGKADRDDRDFRKPPRTPKQDE